jgi:thiamine transport system permease protein
MLCATSFTVVLVLGGGPRSTTLEVAIYQSLRFDFDPSRAVAFTVSQIVLTVAVIAAFVRIGRPADTGFGGTHAARTYAVPGRFETALNLILIAAALVFVGSPMLAILNAGLSADLARLSRDPAVWSATATSLVVGITAASLSLALAFGLASTRMTLRQRRGLHLPGVLERACDNGASLILVVPPVVIGAGWFILLRNRMDVFALAPVLVVAVNAAMAMPFVSRVLRPSYDAARRRHDRLCAQLGVSGIDRLSRWVISVSLLCSAATRCRHCPTCCSVGSAATGRRMRRVLRCFSACCVLH